MRKAACRLIGILILAIGIFLLSTETSLQAFPFTTVYIVRPGRFYHRQSCRVLRTDGRPIAISVSNAREQGFSPCRRCTPPTW